MTLVTQYLGIQKWLITINLSQIATVSCFGSDRYSNSGSYSVHLTQFSCIFSGNYGIHLTQFSCIFSASYSIHLTQFSCIFSASYSIHLTQFSCIFFASYSIHLKQVGCIFSASYSINLIQFSCIFSASYSIHLTQFSSAQGEQQQSNWTVAILFIYNCLFTNLQTLLKILIGDIYLITTHLILFSGYY